MKKKLKINGKDFSIKSDTLLKMLNEIDINFNKVKLSSLVNKGASIKVKIGATDNNNAVVLDWINCSDQLIKKKGIIFPIIPIRVIKMTNLKLRLKTYFL